MATCRALPTGQTFSWTFLLRPAMQTNKLLVVALVFLCASLLTGKVARDARAEDKVRFSVAAVTGSYMDEFVAIEKGYHRDEGLTVEMIRAGGGIATQALIAGDLHFSTSAGSALSAMLRGAEIKVVYTNIDRPGYQVWSGQPEIKSLKDLIGKKIGVTSRGDTQELSVACSCANMGSMQIPSSTFRSASEQHALPLCKQAQSTPRRWALVILPS
jgi:TRAP-type uncharacterized transport system substrate-binding protein